jgi:hypothetical protein|tara:strand:+ start:722 stop:1096 length:375 start_codon:yes stop_codon:yes gene_type:complete
MSGYRLPYRSKFEVKVAADLGKRKIDFQYEKVSFDYVPKIRNYTPDFYLPESKIYIETKGRLTTNDRVKHLLIKEQYPDLDIRFVFVNANNKISRTSKTTYANWCDRHKFLWAESLVPMEWLNE